jgi:hypothetical protein
MMLLLYSAEALRWNAVASRPAVRTASYTSFGSLAIVAELISSRFGSLTWLVSE